MRSAECGLTTTDHRTTDHGTSHHRPQTSAESIEMWIILGPESREPSGAEPLRGGAREPRAASAPLRGAERGRREAGRRGREPFEWQGLVLWCGFDRAAGGG